MKAYFVKDTGEIMVSEKVVKNAIEIKSSPKHNCVHCYGRGHRGYKIEKVPTEKLKTVRQIKEYVPCNCLFNRKSNRNYKNQLK